MSSDISSSADVHTIRTTERVDATQQVWFIQATLTFSNLSSPYRKEMVVTHLVRGSEGAARRSVINTWMDQFKTPVQQGLYGLRVSISQFHKMEDVIQTANERDPFGLLYVGMRPMLV